MKLKKLSSVWLEYPGNYRTDEAPSRPSFELQEKYCERRVPCAVCGEEIGSYESRCYGESGAVHVWHPTVRHESGASIPGECLNAANRHKFPYFYTDG